MAKKVILLTIDELRRDGLGCYGNKKVHTPYSDSLAAEGVLFEEAIAAADLTPVCHSSLLTGTTPNKHNIRTPFSYLRGKTMAEVFKGLGYSTAGFVGVSFLGSKHGFERGFDLYDETAEGARGSESFKFLGGEDGQFTLGNWWIDRFFGWLEQNHDKDFFLWGHYFYVHQGTERYLLEQGLIQEGEEEEFFYLNPKINLMDQVLIKPLLENLKAWGIYEDTNIILMADHGANLGEHPVAKSPLGDFYHPQHVCLYDEDLRIPLIIKAEGLPKGKRIKGMVRQIDVMPTLFDLMGIQSGIDFDGVSLLPFIAKGQAEGLTAYFEDMYESRGPGVLQGMRTDNFKLWRNLSAWTEEFYDLKKDPGEKNNIIAEKIKEDPAFVRGLRKYLNKYLIPQFIQTTETGGGGEDYSLTQKDKEIIENRLRSLGYIE